MGELVDGRWQRAPSLPVDAQGRLRRRPGGFRGWVTADGSPGADGRSFAAEAGRYHLVVALACPWAHRAMLARALFGLEEVVTMDVVEPLLGEDGWQFAGASEVPTDGSTHERLLGATHLHALYSHLDPRYSGRVTTPLLVDKRDRRAVSNESADIMRMLATVLAPLGSRRSPWLPSGEPEAFAALLARIQRGVNEAVYRCGFATTQRAYDEAAVGLFAELDQLEATLTHRRFLCGAEPSEADWRLLTTLVRFDWVYVTHFKCNLRRLVDYPSLLGYTRDLVQWPHVRATVHEAQIKAHYFRSHRQLNPHGIVPCGLAVDLAAPHGRADLV